MAESSKHRRGEELIGEMNYLQRYLVEEEVEHYQEREISRRELVRRVLIMTGSVPATASILLAMGCGAGTPTVTTAPTALPTAVAVTASAARANTAAPVATATAAAAAGTTTRAATAGGAVTTAPGTATRAGSPAASPGTATRTVSPAGSPTRAGSPAATPSGITVSPTDPAIEAGPVTFPGQAGTIFGYKSQPRGVAKAPGIIVIHENRGLTEHIRDMTRRYAKDGFLAVAIDLVSRAGGTERYPDPANITGFFMGVNREDLAQDLLSAVAYLKSQPNFAGPKAGAVGYCFGGGMTWLLATRSTDIGAAVPYYGPPPEPIDDVQNLAGPVLAFYGQTDQRINQNIPRIEEAMQRYNKPFESHIYEGAGHAFNNDTGPNYNANAAKDAYQRSLDFFNRNLRG